MAGVRQLAVITLVIACSGPAAAGGAGGMEGFMGEKTTKDPEGACTTRDVIARVQGALAVLGIEGAWLLTPPIPDAWPIVGRGQVSFFVYTLRALPTGTARWEVQSPFMRIRVRLADVSQAPRTEKLKARALSPVESRSLLDDRPDSTERATESLLQLMCEGRGRAPTGEQARSLRDSYRRWALEHVALAAELRRAAPGFFKWINRSE